MFFGNLGQVHLLWERKCEVTASTLQASILLYFNDKTELILTVLRDDLLKISDEDAFNMSLQKLNGVLEVTSDGKLKLKPLQASKIDAYLSIKEVLQA